MKQIDIINPKVIVLLGEVAYFSIFKKRIKIMKVHGEKIEKDGKIFFITFHPAAARFPKIMQEMKKDFRKLKTLIEKLDLNKTEKRNER